MDDKHPITVMANVIEDDDEDDDDDDEQPDDLDDEHTDDYFPSEMFLLQLILICKDHHRPRASMIHTLLRTKRTHNTLETPLYSFGTITDTATFL